ncbi:hypothetical protein SAMN06264364_10956 [Quadrisphaera granulorum]|uniref:Uncharacterized protein n=1 Tax=Quadrisphaera granulorum TaxID=317664 RepID=A0A316A8B7_9ACTN|nr:hypothetical protein [Quadrisphaera granulorum]PWJ53975.1 hypothetical protein BXY45_10956 [Quadrisphaera granulorum]SZE96432.1 hypothetical protein SAMN06264364_10956 [Quadrisphaera granulorum]
MLVALVMSAAGSAEAEHSGMPPLVYGLIAFAVFLLLLGITWSFRHVGNRH